MASVYIQSMMNIYNETRRNILSETMDVLKNKDLLTDEIRTVFTDMIKTVCINKKRVLKREKKPRFSGYHIFMKEHREVIKKEQPGIKPQQLTTIVSRAWKHVSEEEKRELNERALKLKEAYYKKYESNIEPKKEVQIRKKNPKIRISDCLSIMKNKFPQVRQVHLLAAAKHISTYLKENEYFEIDDKSITYAIERVNKQRNATIFETVKQEEKQESESEESEESEDEEDTTELALEESDED